MSYFAKIGVMATLAVMLLAISPDSFAQGLQPPQEQGQGRGGRGRGGRGGGFGGRGGLTPETDAPAPRDADGRVLLGAAPEDPVALWVGNGGLNVIDHDEVPYQDWAREMVQYRRSSPLEPHTRCKPSGGPRQWLTPYGAEIVEIPDLDRIYIFDIGGPHTYRIIYMDGRDHPTDFEPTYYGHSVGSWEGDTLVIDSVGYNERFWMDRGQSPHTKDLHMVERLTRTSLSTMTYQITVDDPNVYTEPWTAELAMRYMPDTELFEYVCQDNNYAVDIMIGVEQDVDRSNIIP